MDFFEFFRWNLIWIGSVAILFPFNMPLVALAFRIQRGINPLGMPPRELWFRSFLASFLIAAGGFALIFIDYVLTDETGIPSGPIHLTVLMGFIAGACWILFHFFGLDDPMDAVNLFFLYLYLPLFVIYPLHKLLGIWSPFLNFTEGWLKPSF